MTKLTTFFKIAVGAIFILFSDFKIKTNDFNPLMTVIDSILSFLWFCFFPNSYVPNGTHHIQVKSACYDKSRG